MRNPKNLPLIFLRNCSWRTYSESCFLACPRHESARHHKTHRQGRHDGFFNGRPLANSRLERGATQTGPHRRPSSGTTLTYTPDSAQYRRILKKRRPELRNPLVSPCLEIARKRCPPENGELPIDVYAAQAMLLPSCGPHAAEMTSCNPASILYSLARRD